MKREILINNCRLCHNFFEKSFLRPFLPVYKLDIIESYERTMLAIVSTRKVN